MNDAKLVNLRLDKVLGDEFNDDAYFEELLVSESEEAEHSDGGEIGPYLNSLVVEFNLKFGQKEQFKV